MPIMTSIPPKTADPPVKKNAFVHKLFSMLSNPKLVHLIWWTDTPEANTFALYPSKEFADALSGYFKHGNVASFVRQLHMYGFHKVLDPQVLVLNVKDSPIWEFRHSLGKFKKNDEKSLVYIKRRLLLNLLRNLVVENDQPRPTLTPLTPLPLSFDKYPTPVAGVPGAILAYGPVTHYAPQPSPYHPHIAPTLSAGGQVASLAAGAGPGGGVGISSRASHGGSHASHASHASTRSSFASHLATLPHSQPSTYKTPYHPRGMMLPPPPQPQDARMYQVQWQQGAPVYVQYFPHLATPGAEESRMAQDGSALKFRKPWEQVVEKARNPSLLYDPLAPATWSGEPNAAAPNMGPGTNSSRSEMIKLPPLGRAVLPLPSSLPQKLAAILPASKSSPSISPAYSPELRQSSLPPTLISEHLLALQRLSGVVSEVLLNRSIIDRLRPSLIELHFSHGTAGTLSIPNSISGKSLGLSDSIGSHSLSVFSGVSSILSTSSGRTSSFGSVSHIVIADKNKSVGPHEQPVSPHHRSQCLPTVTTIEEEKDLSSNTSIKSRSDTPADVSKPSTPLHKAKVEFLLDASDSKDELPAKRQKSAH